MLQSWGPELKDTSTDLLILASACWGPIWACSPPRIFVIHGNTGASALTPANCVLGQEMDMHGRYATVPLGISQWKCKRYPTLLDQNTASDMPIGYTCNSLINTCINSEYFHVDQATVGILVNTYINSRYVVKLMYACGSGNGGYLVNT